MSLAWRALDARALRIAKVLISILDMHVSLRYCDQRVSLRAARKTGGGRRAHRGHEVRFQFFTCGRGRTRPERPPRAFCYRYRRRRVCMAGDAVVSRVAPIWAVAAAPHLSPLGRRDPRQRPGRAVRTAATRRQQAARGGGRSTPAPVWRLAVSPSRRCWSSGPSSCPGRRPRSRSGGCTARRGRAAASGAAQRRRFQG